MDSSNTHYLWGLDLSGTPQGAGGVGGLFAVLGTPNTSSASIYIPTYDANGNVTEYVDSSGATVAHYAYDAYGNTIAQSGLLADEFKFRFSTKHLDTETGNYYYILRYYTPYFGRFISTDPIGEQGGLNLYGFCANDPINAYDYLGLWKKGDTTDGGMRRIYIREGSESPKELAALVNLDANEIHKWAKYEDKNNCKVSVPNTIIAYWAGDVGRLGRWWVDWNDNVKQLKNEGFFVDERKYSSATLPEYDLERRILTSARQKRLYGLYFWGHGNSSGLAPKGRPMLMNYETLLKNPIFYKLARVHLFACDCDVGARDISADGKGRGHADTYCPWNPWRDYGL